MHFSIIIPAKNEEANIGWCLDSILQLEWARDDYEVIVVDNGSTDRTAAIAESRGAMVFVLPDITISALRNFGAAQARGEVLVFLDADCSVTPGWLAAAAGYLSKTDIVSFGSPPTVPEDATWVQRAWFPIRFKNLYGADTDWLESMNMFVRRESFLNIGGFDESLVTCEDYDLSLRLRQTGRMVADVRIAAIHHGEAASVAHFFRKERWRGKSNMQGIMRHGMTREELPSIVLPGVYLLALLVLGAGFIGSLLLSNQFLLISSLSLLLIWQGALLLAAFRKNSGLTQGSGTFQLYLLLNIYFLARGLALMGFLGK